MEDLMIREGDNYWNRLTSLSGNVDKDKITPSIWLAQVTEIKRILGKELYDVILDGFMNDDLSGNYLTIYNEHVINILVMFSMGDFITKNSIIIGNGGNFKHSPEHAQIADVKENDRLSKYYRDMAGHFEMEFIKYMKTVNVPEYHQPPGDNTFQFNWY